MKDGLHSEHLKGASLGKQDPARHQNGGGASVEQDDSIRALQPGPRHVLTPSTHCMCIVRAPHTHCIKHVHACLAGCAVQAGAGYRAGPDPHDADPDCKQFMV